MAFNCPLGKGFDAPAGGQELNEIGFMMRCELNMIGGVCCAMGEQGMSLDVMETIISRLISCSM